jgi:Tfp pilus assembly protein PilO
MKVTLRRIFTEKRALVAPLAIALVANLAVALFFVYPMTLRASAAQVRATASDQALRAAQAEHDAAQRVKLGKERAAEELRRFYRDVLPTSLAGARRITYLPLAKLARQHRLTPEHRNLTPETDRESQLGRLRVTMVVQGDYHDVRKFIHALETAPEFVVIDDVILSQGAETSAPLVLTLELSTYYLLGGNGN